MPESETRRNANAMLKLEYVRPVDWNLSLEENVQKMSVLELVSGIRKLYATDNSAPGALLVRFLVLELLTRIDDRVLAHPSNATLRLVP